jgi:hypothetical protein
VEHQHVAGAQRHLAHVVADHLLVAVDRQQADAELLAQAHLRGALADPARGRRDHRLGDAGARGIEQVAQLAQARGHLQELVLGEIGHLRARPITPSTLPTQMRMSAGGAGASSPVCSASISGASCRASASPSDMPTSGLSVVTVSSNTSPSMP